jgi:malonate transporter and related proteins
VQAFGHFVGLTGPLFLLVLVGYALARFGGWGAAIADALARFVFSVAVPALLFTLMSDMSKLPRVDPWLLFAYFGACLVVYAIGRLVSAYAFRLDGASQSVFAMGGIFANNVLLGVPLSQVALGPRAMPAVSLVLVFNSLILWTLVTVSVEWARQRSMSAPGLARMVRDVVLNPVVASILAGTAWGFGGLELPEIVARVLAQLAAAAVPLSLVALGMSLAHYGAREGWRQSVAMAGLKLVVHPLVVFALARMIGLPTLETQVIVVMASLPVGANVYLMSRAFDTLQGPVSTSLVLSTALAAVTTPLVIALVGAG